MAVNQGRRKVTPGRSDVRVVLATVPDEPSDALLDAGDRARLAKMTAPIRRREFVAGRTLLRTQLSYHADADARSWRFEANEHGRLEVAGHSSLCFNLSHTRGLLACVIAKGADVGIDVEDTSLERQTVQIADRFFSPQEVTELRALPESRQRGRFFDYWTLKESYIKARGMGLAIPLDKFTFRFDPLRVELDPTVGTDAALWQFWLQNPTPTHRLAVAVRRPAEEPVNLTLQWVSL